MHGQHSHSWKRFFYYALAVSTAVSNGMMVPSASAATPATQTPIKHVVVIFQENASFDHYFATYPNAQFATNEAETSWVQGSVQGTPGSASATVQGTPITASNFKPVNDTPTVNGLTGALLTNNPNKTANGNTANPTRLVPAGSYTCSQNHSYGPEQAMVDSGLMDKFPQQNMNRGNGCAPDGSTAMDYYDGNTVTGLWNIAQRFSMSDNSFGSTFGPSTPGAINLVSGQTHGGVLHFGTTNGNVFINPADSSITDIGDLDAFNDDCGADRGSTVNSITLEMTSKNIGDLLNAQNLTWGWFQGGFAPTQPATFNTDGSLHTPAVCGAVHPGHQVMVNGTNYVVPNPPINFTADVHTNVTDYSSHHQPFMYYASTRNPHHLRPLPGSVIGSTLAADGVTVDPANHQYDTSDFFAAVTAGALPAVTFLKAPSYQDGHPGNSDPLTEQAWIAQVLNALQASSVWSTTAVFIAWDDSDGWYDHQMGPIVSPSNVSVDSLAGASNCGTPATGAFEARCGRGPRLPLLLASPWSKVNYVDHNGTDQSSIMAFVEYNWNLGTIDGATPPANGQGSFDRVAGSVLGMFDFTSLPNLKHLILDPIRGTVVSSN
jgi:phospholipase C